MVAGQRPFADSERGDGQVPARLRLGRAEVAAVGLRYRPTDDVLPFHGRLAIEPTGIGERAHAP